MRRELAEALARLIPAETLQRLGDLSMEYGATGGPEIPIQGVLDERVGEGEAPYPVPVLPKQRCRDRLGEQVGHPRP